MADPREPDDFPTYADLTQTIGWGETKAAPIEGHPLVDLEQPRYVEGALLGAGGMGKVVLALDERIGREVAVKELHPDRSVSSEDHARFLREARVQGQLEHPSIVPVYDIDRRPDGTTFFTMRRVVGKTVHAILQDLRGGAAPTAQHELLTAFGTVCLAVDYAHSRGVIHRDLKPANLMLGDFGEVYVLDWGLARVVADGSAGADVAERLSMPGELLGTPMYMAPEQMMDPDVGPAADVFSLGAILFELLTLTTLRDPAAPFVPGDARPSVRTPDRPVAPELEAICVKATAPEPGDRFSTARALHEAVMGYLEGDRDRELRRARAATHALAARAALERADRSGADYEVERGNAMRELASALAFDPSNHDHVAMLGEILDRPPRVVPPEVRAQIDVETAATVRSFARYTGPTMMSWFLFLPFILLVGVRDWSLVGVVSGAAVVAALVGFYAQAREAITPKLVVLAIVLVICSMASTSAFFGPMILTPTVLAASAIVAQAFPTRLFRNFTVVLATVAMCGLVALELAGVLSSYAFEGGAWIVKPQLLELSRTGTLLFVLLLNASAMIVPCMFIAGLRRDLSIAQQRQLLQSWHFRRLGDALMRA